MPLFGAVRVTSRTALVDVGDGDGDGDGYGLLVGIPIPDLFSQSRDSGLGNF